MGCSASRSYDFITTKDPQNQWNSSFSSHSQSPYSYSESSSTLTSRTLSLPPPLVHHPAMCKGDTNHLVSLTSTTYGSLVLIHPENPKNPNGNVMKSQNGIDQQDPLSPDSVINTWELMEGLDDLDSNELDKSYEFVEHSDSKPLWKHLSEEQLLAKMDPNVASSYRQALCSKRFGVKELEDCSKPEIVRAIESSDVNDTSSLSSLLPHNEFYLKGTEDNIVLYFTSLRGIRKTYEDCCTVRMIFRGFRVCVDERDVSMDSSYRKELQGTLEGKAVRLPQVFIGGKYIGGAEEIKHLHEGGELAKLVDGFAVKHSGFICEGCGDARFIPCPNCNGSRKVFEEEEGKQGRCPNCNENGLIRCPGCCP